MSSKKSKIGFSLIIVLIVNFLVFKIAVKKEVNLTRVPVAKETIYPRTKISKEDLMYVEVPKVSINDFVVVDEENIINKYSDIQTTIPKQSLFYKEVLFEEKDLPDYPSILLNENQVVYNLNSDLVKMSGNSIVVGQKVDVYTTLNKRNETPIVDLLVSSVRIVGVKDKKGYDVTHPDSSRIPYIVLLALDKDIMPIVRTADELATLELYAHSNVEADEESQLNEHARILEYVNE